VEYVRQSRHSGKSKFSIFSSQHAAEFIRAITSYSLVPLYLGIILGLITFMLSILLIFYALYAKFNGLAVAGTTSIIITISFFSGIILMTLGIIGIYLARIYEQTRGRAKYIIKEIKDYKSTD
jgi:dolichol-phosphate mannosyltransferase